MCDIGNHRIDNERHFKTDYHIIALKKKMLTCQGKNYT